MGRHIIISASWFGLISLSLCPVNPAAAQVDQPRAEAYFEEAAAICQRDGGRLWGVSLCGPMVFADARTRTLATNLPRPAGEWPRVLGFTNAPVEWGGSRWAAYMWDFTTSLPDPRTRREFMLHELFHLVQPDLGLITLSGQNAHLDTVEGRIWLRLEWRALSRALDQSALNSRLSLDHLADLDNWLNIGIIWEVASDYCCVWREGILKGRKPVEVQVTNGQEWNRFIWVPAGQASVNFEPS